MGQKTGPLFMFDCIFKTSKRICVIFWYPGTIQHHFVLNIGLSIFLTNL